MSCSESTLKNDFEEKGFFVLRSLIPPELLKDLKDDCDKLGQLPGVKVMYEKGSTEKVRRMEIFYDKTKTFVQVHQRFTKALEDIFGEEMTIFKDKLNFKGPHGPGFYPHQDGIFLFPKNGKQCKGWYHYASRFYNVNLAIDDNTLENGCLWIAPVETKSFEEQYEDTKKTSIEIQKHICNDYKFEPFVLTAGDAVVFDSRCPHMSYGNNTPLPRRNLYYTYNLKAEGEHYSSYFYDKFNAEPDRLKAQQTNFR